jgi:Ni/Co efflux regulator RcnB
MKRLLSAAFASVVLLGSLSTGAIAQQPDRRPPQGDTRSDQPRSENKNDNNNRRHGNERWRDDRRDARWDEQQHNGYYVGRQWHGGPPPSNAYNRRGFQLGYKPWRRGDRLGYFNTRYSEVDYRQQNLKPPQRGYHYVRDDSGDILLAAIATRLIVSIIANQ